MDREASEAPNEVSLARGCEEEALHWAEQSTPLLGRRRKRNLSSDSEESLRSTNKVKRIKLSVHDAGADSKRPTQVTPT